MKNLQKANEWLKRAKSNLARVISGKISDEILYEDLCFDAQQAVEKALKALCIMHGIHFGKVHDIAYLMELLEKGDIRIPKRLHKAKLLTDYAVETRYPGYYVPVDEEMYRVASKLADSIVLWVERKLRIRENKESNCGE